MLYYDILAFLNVSIKYKAYDNIIVVLCFLSFTAVNHFAHNTCFDNFSYVSHVFILIGEVLITVAWHRL